MRKIFWPLVAVALIAAVTIHWAPVASEGMPVSIVPGWHTTILSPWLVTDLFASAVLLLIAAVIVVQQFGEWKAACR